MEDVGSVTLVFAPVMCLFWSCRRTVVAQVDPVVEELDVPWKKSRMLIGAR